MNVALRMAPMTREAFFAWAQARDGRYEFDGDQPVAMTGGTPRHNQITLAIHRALYGRLKGGPYRPFGAHAGMATIDGAVRYPDALVTCSQVPADGLLIPGVVVVFEVVSPSSERTDRIIKPLEYHAVPSILRYVTVEQSSVGLTSFERAHGEDTWRATTLIAADILRLPELGIEIPVAELYEGADMPADPDAAA